MPERHLRPCNKHGCPNLTRKRYCIEHAYIEKVEQRERDRGRRSSAQRSYGHEWRKIRDKHLKENPYCEVCGEPATEVDHILRRELGGTDEPENLQSLCKTHHSQKTRREGCVRGTRGVMGQKSRETVEN